MAMQLQVVAKSATTKKIAANKVNRTMGSDACWFSSDASAVSVNDYLSFANADYVVLQAGETVDLKFIPDTGGSNGQGTTIPSGLDGVDVIAVNGTCKGLRAINANLATTKANAYSAPEGFTLSVGATLRRGDMAVCDAGSGSYITLRFKAFAAYASFSVIPACKMYADTQ